MFSELEKKFLRSVVEKELEKFRENEEVVLDSPDLKLIEGAHNYENFIEDILEKLQ